MTLPRTLTAVPRLPHVYLEIVEAIQTLTEDGALQKSQHPSEAYAPSNTRKLVHEIIRKLRGEMRKAGMRWSKRPPRRTSPLVTWPSLTGQTQHDQ